MARKSIGETAMTDAERQARYRAARAAGVPVIRTRRPVDHRGRARRWTDHVAGLVEAQVEYAAWLESLPENLRDSPLADALQAICDLDLTELEVISPPRGLTALGRRSLHRWVHRVPPAPQRQPLDGHSASRGSPMDYRHKPSHRGVNFRRR